MNAKQFLGQKVSSFQEYDTLGPVTGVSVAVDDSQEYRAGDDSGYVLDVDCSWGSQAMADDLLAKLQGKTYQGFRAENGALPIDSELGDGITVGGIYSMLAYQKLTFGAGHMSEVAAPGESTLDHEYPYTSSTQRAFSREIASVRSSITKTSEEIRLEVSNELTQQKSEIDQTIDEIRLSIYGGTDADGNEQKSIIDQKLDSISLSVTNGSTSSTIKLTVDGVEVSSEAISMSGLVTFTGLSDGTTTIDGACIKTGTISADRIDASELEVSAANISGTLTASQIDASGLEVAAANITGAITAGNLQGGSISLLDAAGGTAGSITLSGAVTADYAVDISSGSGGLRIVSGGRSAIYVEAGGGGQMMIYNGNTTFTGSIKPNDDGNTYCGTSSQKWAAVYASTGTIQTSDCNKKHDIETLPEKYLDFLKDLPPYRFKMNENTSDRYHVGYIAQEVEMLMEKHGIDSQEFGGFVKGKDEDGNDIYMLRYEEFIAIHTAAIQDIYKRLGANT
jgi:hypothetical protein